MVKTKDLNIEYIEELADIVMNEIDPDDDDFNISVIGKYKEIKSVLKEIIAGYDVNINDIELISEDGNGYSAEYELGIWSDDGVINIDCQPVKYDGEYLTFYGDILYIFSDCNSRLVNYHCDFEKAYSVIVDEDECEDECDCDTCPCCGGKKDSEISTSTSSYSINGKPVTKEEFNEKYTELQKKYEKNMGSILDDYCSFMDEFNTLFARLW